MVHEEVFLEDLGYFPTTDMQTHPLGRDHLDIKDAKCPKENYGRQISYHIISRLGAAAVQMLKCSKRHVELRSTRRLLCEAHLFIAIITLFFDIFRIFFIQMIGTCFSPGSDSGRPFVILKL